MSPVWGLKLWIYLLNGVEGSLVLAVLGLVGVNLIVCGILGLRALEVDLYIHDLGFGVGDATVLDMSAY